MDMRTTGTYAIKRSRVRKLRTRIRYRDRREITMMLLCEEFDKYENRETLYYVVKKDVTNDDVWGATLRSRFNPELHYYVTTLDEQTVDGKMVSEIAILNLFKKEESRKNPAYFLELV